ncbi:MAG: hypothetical protein AAF253_13470 [Pseudomonadota bacterium]
MPAFIDTFMWYGAVLAMGVLVVSLVLAMVRGARTSQGGARAGAAKPGETGAAAPDTSGTGDKPTTGSGQGDKP